MGYSSVQAERLPAHYSQCVRTHDTSIWTRRVTSQKEKLMNTRLILTFLTAMAEVFAHILLGLLLAIAVSTTIIFTVAYLKEYALPIFFFVLFLVGIFALIVARFQELNSEYMAKSKEVVDILKR